MFLIFIMLIAAGLAGASAHLYTSLTLQAQTVAYTIQAISLECHRNGVLAYAVAQLSQDARLQQRIRHEKQVITPCDIFNTSENRFLQGMITYSSIPEGYLVVARIDRKGQALGGMRARITQETRSEKVVYSCVALEAF